MLNRVVKLLTGKDIIIFHPHRNSNPLLNKENRKQYFFLKPHYIWKATGLFGRNTKIRYQAMAAVLTFIDPLSIIDINWINKRHSLYFAWCKKRGKKFIVIQHGIYYAGIIKDISEKYVKCTTHLVWGEHFKQVRERDNRGKNCEYIVYGNPVYNMFDRSKFKYKKKPGNDILVAVSVIKGERLKKLYDFLERLEIAGFKITVKEHNYQKVYSKQITGYTKSKEVLYDVLKEQRYDYIVTDISSAMTDIIFFKNRAIYFSPTGVHDHFINNVYEQYLENVALRDSFFTDREDLKSLVSVKSQENLLEYMIKTKDTNNSIDILFNQSKSP